MPMCIAKATYCQNQSKTDQVVLQLAHPLDHAVDTISIGEKERGN